MTTLKKHGMKKPYKGFIRIQRLDDAGFHFVQAIVIDYLAAEPFKRVCEISAAANSLIAATVALTAVVVALTAAFILDAAVPAAAFADRAAFCAAFVAACADLFTA